MIRKDTSNGNTRSTRAEFMNKESTLDNGFVHAYRLSEHHIWSRLLSLGIALCSLHCANAGELRDEVSNNATASSVRSADAGSAANDAMTNDSGLTDVGTPRTDLDSITDTICRVVTACGVSLGDNFGPFADESACHEHIDHVLDPLDRSRVSLNLAALMACADALDASDCSTLATHASTIMAQDKCGGIFYQGQVLEGGCCNTAAAHGRSECAAGLICETTGQTLTGTCTLSSGPNSPTSAPSANGSSPDGASCASDDDCASGLCVGSVCAQPGDEGDDCIQDHTKSGSCRKDLYCEYGKFFLDGIKCRAYADEGDHCGRFNESQCKTGLFCNKSEICEKAAAPQQPCVKAMQPSCQHPDRYYCDASLGTPVCTQRLGVGSTCNSDAVCERDLECAAGVCASRNYCAAPPTSTCAINTPAGGCFPQRRALRFDDVNEHIRFRDGAGPDISSGPFTIEFWFRAPRAVGSTVLYSHGCLACGEAGFEITMSTGSNQDVRLTRRSTTGGGQGSQSHIFRSMPNLGDGNWHHVAIIVDTTTATFVVDGSTATGLRWRPANVTPDSGVTIGAPFGRFATRKSNHTVHNFRVWSVARKVSEIRRDRFVTKPVGAGLLANWRFDEGQGQYVRDSSGNGHDGIVGRYAAPDAKDPKWIDL